MNRYAAFSAVPLIVGCLTLLACDPNGGSQPGVTTAVAETWRECPHGPMQDTTLERDAAGRIGQLTEGTSEVPEYNDCQRFIVGDTTGVRYGGRYAIYAVRLDSLPVRSTEHGNQLGIPAALVYAPDGVPYGPLGIQGQFSCLVMQGDVENPKASLTARMIGNVDIDDCAHEWEVEGEAQPDLEVRRVTAFADGDETDALYPPVARWGYDRSSRTHYMILKCGRSTCLIGPLGFTPAAAPDSLAKPGDPMDREKAVRVHGWYDAQPLAVLRGGQLVPSDTWGVAIPHADLGRYNSATAFQDAFVPVAELAVTSAEYKSKLNLDETSRTGALNEVWACQGNCPGVPTSLDCSEEDGLSEGPGTAWRAMIVSAVAKDTTYHCIRRYDTDASVDVPATVRWRWRADDEKLWFRCVTGCCDLER